MRAKSKVCLGAAVLFTEELSRAPDELVRLSLKCCPHCDEVAVVIVDDIAVKFKSEEDRPGSDKWFDKTSAAW